MILYLVVQTLKDAEENHYFFLYNQLMECKITNATWVNEHRNLVTITFAWWKDIFRIPYTKWQ